MKRIILFNLLFVITASSYLNAQNPMWILAPNYWDGIFTSPLPTSGDYNGEPPQAASNMQLDAQGNILFFVIDDVVYDKDGGIIGAMQDNLQLLEDFDKYITFRASLGDRNIAQLNENEIEFLQELAIKEERVGGYARNILCFFMMFVMTKSNQLEHKK